MSDSSYTIDANKENHSDQGDHLPDHVQVRCHP